MESPGFIEVSRSQVEDGSWLESAIEAWRSGKTVPVRVKPEPSEDSALERAIKTMLQTNGSYEMGDRVVIHTRPSAIEMACEAAHQLLAQDCDVIVLMGFGSLPKELDKLLRAAAVGAGVAPRPEQVDVTTLQPSLLDPLVAAYLEILEAIESGGRGHWIVPIGSTPDPDTAFVPGLQFYGKMASKALAPIGALRAEGKLKSHDVWFNPTQLDVDRLNEGLPEAEKWGLDEWRRTVFEAMAVPAEDLRRLAFEIEAVNLLVEASRTGRRIRYERDDGTDITFAVTNRPVILDCGSVGVNSLGGTTESVSRITNQPTTEVFTAPLEDSMDGVIVYTQPERTMLGVINSPYRIEVREGKVVSVDAPDEESRKILRNYTGLEPYDGKPMEGEEKEAFLLRRVIAEMAIAGFNPAFIPHIQSGRLRPVTGLVLLDEKLGDHQAFGANDQFQGKTPSTLGNHRVEHTDFVGSIERRVRLL